jgi:hypothetical protein
VFSVSSDESASPFYTVLQNNQERRSEENHNTLFYSVHMIFVGLAGNAELFPSYEIK